jgi:CoA:oxalate CoA-transferase
MRALEGIKVLDFSVGHDASAATMYLADNGAEVIKIEDLSTGGDIARTWEPVKNGKSAYFELLNRGKKSVMLDFTDSKTLETLKNLIEKVDIVVENLPIDKLKDMGLSYKVMKKINPEIIYLKLSPFGTTGPMRDYPLTEYTTFSFGGYLQTTGMTDDVPSMSGYPIMGYSIAHLVLSAINAAYISRLTTGRGQMIDMAMADCAVCLLEDRYASYQHEKLDSIRVGNAHPTITPYDTIKCKGGFVSLSPSTQKMWEDLCDVLGFPEIKFLKEYADIQLRQEQYFRGDLKTRIENALAGYTGPEATKLLNDVGIPAAPVFTIDEAYNCDQFKAKGVVVQKHDDVLGDYAVPSVLGVMSETPVDVTKPAPELGADTDSVLDSMVFFEQDEKAV